MANVTPEEQLVTAFSSLKFVQPIRSESTEVKVTILCRVTKGADVRWAQVVEKILRAAEETEEFTAHICRLYFLLEDNMVYGWHVAITSEVWEYALETLGGLFPKSSPPARKAAANLSSMSAYSPPLEADAKGNPLVGKQVMSMPFTGMERKRDRNIPSLPKDGKGGGRGVSKIS